MATKDLLQRFILDNAPVRGEYIYLEETFQTIINQHAYPAPIRQLLGQALCVAGLLSAIIKFEGRLTLQFRGKGQLKLLLAQCDNDFHMRGLMKWDGNLSYEELVDSFKDGVLAIMLDPGPGKNRYQGIVEWQGNSLAESIEHYFRKSEQLETRVWLSVDEKRASGFLIQVIPGSQNGAIEESARTWQDIEKATAKLQPQDLLNVDYETLLRMLYPEEEIRIFPSAAASFQCECSRARSEEAIRLLGQEEAEEELRNNQSIVVTCDFCNREYMFDRQDITTLFMNQSKPPGDSKLH